MPTRARLGIRAQILAIAAAPALIVTAILVFVIYRGNILEGDRALDRQGALLAAQLAANLEYALLTGAVDQIPGTVASSIEPAAEFLGTPTRRIVVLDRNHQTLFSTATEKAAATAELDETLAWMVSPEVVKTFSAPIHLDPVEMGMFADPGAGRRYLGKVIVEVPTAPIKIAQFRALLWDLGLVMLTFCGALGLAYWIGRRLSGAIQEAAEAIRRIKGGDLSVRLQKTESTEIGTLQEGVNLAAEAIVKGREALEAALAKVQGEHDIALSELRVQTEAAETASQAKSLFLARVSHEMRTPLYSIQGLVEQLRKTTRQDGDVRCLDNLLRASQTLQHTIGGILDFTQLESGKYQPMRKPFDPWEEVESLIDTVAPLAAEQGLYVDVIVANDLPPGVIGDRKGFRAIVANVIANAVKFTRQGGIGIRLELDSPPSEETAAIRLQVHDTGCGIPKDQLASIFEPFEQIEGGLNRRYAGSGLGLSIVKNYCEAMGGRIAVDSKLGDGSTFVIRLPFDVHLASADQGEEAEFSQLSALVLDKRPSFRESLESRLSSLGFDVASSPCPLDELSSVPLPSRRFDLVAVRDLSRVDSPAEIVQRLGAWAEHVVSFETCVDNDQSQRLRDQGVDAVLWCGASRNSIAAALRTMRENQGDEGADSDLWERGEFPLSNGLEGKCVLIAEDFAMNREIMSEQLKNHGAQVVEAGDGDEAITLGLRPGIDLILMDIQMPGRDGISAIQAIRQQPEGQGIPIIGFTASADKPTHRRVLDAGADGVLTKPISEAELIAAVHNQLAARVH